MTRILRLENSHLFSKLSGKAQIIIAGEIEKDFYRNRQTHSYEVKSISEIIAKNIKYENIEAIGLVALGHDLGHSAFGHDGATALNKLSKKFGLNEGFSDNNNNLSMISHNGISFSRYELVSLIKYPDKLYQRQKEEYLPILNYYINKESKIWGENLTRTVACNIMDRADEISYSTSDMFDSFATGYTKTTLEDFFFNRRKELSSNPIYSSLLLSCGNAVKEFNKRMLRGLLLELKLVLVNDLIWDYKLSCLTFKNRESLDLLDSMIKFNYNEFIKNKNIVKKRKLAIKKFKKFAKYFFTCDPKKFPSDLYRTKYLYANSDIERLEIRRDMISDTSDQYVLNYKIPKA